MINLTPYNLQPVFRRLTTLYGYVQTVTDCVTFVLSCLCCQCWEPMPLSQSSIGCTFHTDVCLSQEEKLQFGKECGEPLDVQQQAIDFTPEHKGIPELQQKKVCQFWNVESVPPCNANETFGLTVTGKTTDIMVPSTPDEYPGVHLSKTGEK